MSERTNTKLVTDKKETSPYKKCGKCKLRIGAHSTWESLRCNLITKEEARKIFKSIKPRN